MTGNSKNDDLTPRLMEVLKELDILSNWFETAVKLLISIPLFINASAVIALTTFFSNKSSPDFHIKIASLFFIMGTFFGIFTLIFEYLTPFFAGETSKKYLIKEAHSKNSITELLKRFDAYDLPGFLVPKLSREICPSC